MGFQQGLSGLSAASTQLDTIGNNVANASTVGYKAGQATFADVYANSLNNGNASKVGIGVRVAEVKQQFTQGNTTPTENPLDVAINGNGFYRMSSDGVITYSRNGQFTLSKDGYIENSNGSRLTGYAVNASGVLMKGSPVELNIDTADLAPNVTTKVTANLNLNSTDSIIPASTAFDPTDPTTYNNATTVTVFDSLGNSHDVQTFYKKTADNTWQVNAIVDGDTTAANVLSVGTLKFTSAGAIDTTTTTLPFAININNISTGAAKPLAISVDYTGTTQYGSKFSVNALKQDGYTSGRLSSFSVASDGTLTGNYTNGKTSILGQVVLANFSNPNGLQTLGNNEYAETATSGAALIGTPDSSNLGVLQSYATEDSNVDLTKELVNMITAQRYYQANAQTIKTENEVMQTLVNLK